MMKKHKILCLAAFAIASLSIAHAQSTAKKPPPPARAAPAPVANAGVRVTCEGISADARVMINGVLKGECPLDANVPAGPIVLQAVKPLDSAYEMVFEARFNLGADVVRRVEIKLNERNLQFRADAIARADAAIEVESARKEAQQLKALPELERVAQGGDAAAMARLGIIYERGLAGPVNFGKAIAWYARAAQAGDPAAMSTYGVFLYRGRGVPKDEAQAVALFANAAAKGDPEGMFWMGSLHLYGSAGLEKNPKQALAFFRDATERGHPQAPLHRDYALLRLGEPLMKSYDNMRLVVTAYLKRAEGGEDFDAMKGAESQLALGVADISRNPELALKYGRTAFRYYKKAAASGDADSIDTLASMYQSGTCTPKDIAMAEKLYRQAASLGYQPAEKHLAELLK